MVTISRKIDQPKRFSSKHKTNWQTISTNQARRCPRILATTSGLHAWRSSEVTANQANWSTSYWNHFYLSHFRGIPSKWAAMPKVFVFFEDVESLSGRLVTLSSKFKVISISSCRICRWNYRMVLSLSRKLLMHLYDQKSWRQEMSGSVTVASKRFRYRNNVFVMISFAVQRSISFFLSLLHPHHTRRYILKISHKHKFSFSKGIKADDYIEAPESTCFAFEAVLVWQYVWQN